MFTDIATRDARESMELPFLSLSKNPRFTPISYKTEDVELTVTGGAPIGIANIWDWDLVMWLMSQIRQAIDAGQPTSRKLRFHRHAFLKDVRRMQGGSQYERLEESIARLKNTNVVTTIRSKCKRTVMFSWIEYADLERDASGRVTHATVVLPEWLYEAVSTKSLILSLHRDYFLLTGGLERWLYRFIRKSAGRNAHGWKWKLRTLYERSGSTREYKYFARDLRYVISRGRLLDYELSCVVENGETVLSARYSGKTGTLPADHVCQQPADLRLKTATYEQAKELVPGYDIYALEAEWKAANEKRATIIRNADAAFLGWCKAVRKRRCA